jgi:acetyl-CoA carboxylase / biotin carboxylase 1
MQCGASCTVLFRQCGVDQEIFKKAQVFTVEEAVASAARIGYPVMLKASEGGGGKGIRMSASEEELLSNFVQVQNEVPGSPMFMMQLCTQARHLEVQIVGDEHGQAVALNGRDCSTQRRFQKIFEEGPPTIAKPDTFREMEKAAMRLTQSIGYSGAGTVEYLYQASTDTFAFLELNPRLQVCAVSQSPLAACALCVACHLTGIRNCERVATASVVATAS